MKSTVLLVLSCAVATTLASPEQLLLSEVIGVLTFRLRESRPRRDLENKNNETSDVETTPSNREPWCFCGNENFLQTFLEKNQDIAYTCLKDYVPLVQENGNDIVEKKSTFTSTISQSLCSNTECIFKKLNFLTSEGKLAKSAIKTYFMDNIILVEDWMQNIAGKAVDQCLNSGSSLPTIEGILLDIAKHLKTCNSEPYKFSTCLLLEMAKNCPAEQKSKDPSCRLIQLSLDLLKKIDKN